MLIVGINSSGYVSSAAVVVDGELVFACAEERLDRRKFSKYFPMNAIRAGLEHVGARWSDVDCFAIGFNPAINVAGRMRAGFSEWPAHPGQRLYSNANYLLPELGTDQDFTETMQIFRRGTGREHRLRFVTHHLAHAANAFLLSGAEAAAVLTCDGYGERATTTWSRATAEGITTIREVSFPHSIGSIYATLTQFLGFRPNADEWKVMGAAGHGDPSRYYDSLRRLVAWDDEGRFEVDLSYFNYFDFDVSPMYRPKLEALLGPPRQSGEPLEQRHYDLAAGVQRLTETYLAAALRALEADCDSRCVCVSGGVFMNSVFNGKAALESSFERVFVPYAPDDNGNSIGAALWVAWQEGVLTPGRMASATPFLGCAYDADTLRRTLEDCRLSYRCSTDIAADVAALIESGKIVGWFQGRMEFGDRALGNRSILADPRDASVRDRLNAAVKHREAFRPFAPAILDSAVGDYFDLTRPITSPYMEKVLPVRASMRPRVPAIVHADGTARLQTVRREDNPLFYDLIDAFRRRTGVPLVVNTSFNVNGEPIVESHTDAIRTFYTSGLDALALGPYLLCKGGV